MTIPAGMLDTRVTFEVPNPARQVTLDNRGREVAEAGSPPLVIPYRRWASVEPLKTTTASGEVVVKEDEITLTVRYESMVSIEAKHKVVIDGERYTIRSKQLRKRQGLIDFIAVRETV